jgi:hypothetical protein
MLSPDERAGLLAEARDPRRREVLAAARAASRRAVTPAGLLAFLSEASALLAPLSVLPRPRPGTGDRYLL